jgi:hypothetical protein
MVGLLPIVFVHTLNLPLGVSMGIILTPALFFEFWASNENPLFTIEARMRMNLMKRE